MCTTHVHVNISTYIQNYNQMHIEHTVYMYYPPIIYVYNTCTCKYKYILYIHCTYRTNNQMHIEP